MLEKTFKLLWFLCLVETSIAALCLRYPLCYCSTNVQRSTKIICKNVTDITPIQNLLLRYPHGVYSLRIIAPELISLHSKAFSGHIITVFEIDAPLVEVPDDALFGIFDLLNINFIGGHFGTISKSFSNERIKTVQLVDGLLESIGNQLQNNTGMTDALLYSNKISQISIDAFLNAKSLEYLNLSSNYLGSLDPDVFQHILQLKSIDLSNNRLFTVDGSFDSLNPQEIKLYGNNLTNLDYAFHPKMWALKFLDLGGNQNLNISSRTFDDKIQHLATLCLSDNNFTELDPYLLRPFRNLYKLSLNGNHLSSMPKEFFSHTLHLRTLELARNNLPSVAEIFPVDKPYYFVTHTLKTLNLNSNKLSSIQFGSDAKSILHLDLSMNLINYVQDHDLVNLTSVINLNLSGNPLLEVDSGAFKQLSNLRTLDLSETKLKHLNHSVRHLDQLEELLADSATLTSVDKEEFLGLNSLEIVSLKNNSLESVYEVMQNLSNLKTLDISNNNLTTLSLNSLPTNGTKMVTLKKLWMAGNPLSCDCRLSWILDWRKIKGSNLEDEPICQLPTNLQGRAILSLNQSDLDFWQEDCPKFCVCKCKVNGGDAYTTVDCTNKNMSFIPEEFPFNVREIDLENNAITSFSGFSGKNLTNLEILILENNSLCNMNLDFSPSMKELKLAGNNLTRFPLSEWNTSLPLKLLTLSDNPWICDCEAWGFRQWLVKYQISVTDVQAVRCNLHGKLANRIIIQLEKEDMCSNEKYTIIAIIAGITALVFILCLLCYITRKTLVVVFNSWGCGYMKSNERHDYSFHAFLLYAEEDEDFALNIITEGLETKMPEIKLFNPTRQIFLTNSAINIESSLADCCKVIVLLSKDFLKSAQCMELLKSSMSCSIQYSSRRMIFILMGKGNIIKEVDLTLQAVINNNVSLRCGEFFFWQKLKYYLPKMIKRTIVDEENNPLIQNEVNN